jgi:glycosyltransferase involved in cell wall biosynthesis
MIVKNEEDIICRCLDSIKDAVDEIVIVDTGSNDRTKELVKRYTKKVYDYKWNDDFASARNFSLSKATKDYVMWLDADDILDKKSCENLKQLKEDLDGRVDIVMLKYNITFDKDSNPTFNYYRERIFNRSKGFKFVGEVHEVVVPSGNIIYNDNVFISHKKNRPQDAKRNLNIYKKLIADGKKLDPRHMYYYSRELFYNKKYNEAINVLNQYLDEGNGWVEDNIGACKILSDCYKSLGQNTNSIKALFQSFCYDTPRAEICCDIGKYFKDLGLYEKAIYWYEEAASKDLGKRNSGFIVPGCYNIIPYLELCVCFDRLKDTKKAYEYNEKVGKINPNDPSYLYNKEYFEKLMK